MHLQFSLFRLFSYFKNLMVFPKNLIIKKINYTKKNYKKYKNKINIYDSKFGHEYHFININK